MSAAAKVVRDVLVVHRVDHGGQPVPVVRFEHDGRRATVVWLGPDDASLLTVRTPFGALVPEDGPRFLDALQRRLQARPGWRCERGGGAA